MNIQDFKKGINDICEKYMYCKNDFNTEELLKHDIYEYCMKCFPAAHLFPEVKINKTLLDKIKCFFTGKVKIEISNFNNFNRREILCKTLN